MTRLLARMPMFLAVTSSLPWSVVSVQASSEFTFLGLPTMNFTKADSSIASGRVGAGPSGESIRGTRSASGISSGQVTAACCGCGWGLASAMSARAAGFVFAILSISRSAWRSVDKGLHGGVAPIFWSCFIWMPKVPAASLWVTTYTSGIESRQSTCDQIASKS